MKLDISKYKKLAIILAIEAVILIVLGMIIGSNSTYAIGGIFVLIFTMVMSYGLRTRKSNPMLAWILIIVSGAYLLLALFMVAAIILVTSGAVAVGFNDI